LTAESLARKGSTLKNAATFLSKPGIISLGGGLPSSAYFPFAEMTVTVPTVPGFTEQETMANGTKLVAGKNDLLTGKSIFDISTAFNYGQGTGSAQLLRWVTEHTELAHDPPYADWACNMTIGSTSAIDMAMRMFLSPGDYMLAEEYTFPTAVEATMPLGIKMVGIKMDQGGMVAEALDDVLTQWNPKERDGAAKPRVIYTVPTGQNPTGATMGKERRQQIYAICQKHDVFILEDEPYYFLQMPEYVSGTPSPDSSKTDHETFLKSLIPSFLSMDVDGRVMRMDSFSKVIAPGSRIGWITCSEQLIERYKVHVDCSTQGPSGFSQLMLFKMLDEHWGHSGYLDWLKHIRTEYTRRRDVIVQSCERHLPTDIVSWAPPRAGMFVSYSLIFCLLPDSLLTELIALVAS
jgi:aromatic amino acid aminotransferase I